MAFSHDRLVVYQHAIEFVAWSHTLLNGVDAVGSVRTQLERAATSIPLNIAEGNVKSSPRDRRRYWEIALGSTVECAAILDVLVDRRLRTGAEVARGKDAPERIVSMLVKLVQSTDAHGGREGRRRRATAREDDNDDDKDGEDDEKDNDHDSR